MQELTELRSEYAKHFLADDGKRLAHLFTYPVHYLDRDTQAWEDSTYLIEVDDAVSGFVRNMKSAPFRVRFGSDQVRFGFAQGKYINYVFQEANVITPAFGDHKAAFAGLYEQTDVIYSVLSKELKQEIILQDNTAPNSFNILLTGNVTAELIDNSIRFMDSDTVLGGIPAPIVTDAEGNAGAATFSLTDGTLTIAVDTAWLSTAIYPVTIDPTTTIQPDPTAGKDSYVEVGSETNHGNEITLGIGLNGANLNRTLVQFDISSVAAEIVAATAYIYYLSGPGDMTVNAHKITSTWAEATVKSSNMPTYESTVLGSFSLLNADSSKWLDFDVSDLAESWRNGDITNYGLLFEGDAAFCYKGFCSSDYTADASLRPKLVLTVRQPAPTISAPASTDEASPTSFSNKITPAATFALGASYTQSNYQYQIYDSDDNLVYDSGTIAGTAVSFSVPAAAGLEYGEIYSIRISSMDAADSNWSEWSELHYLQCSMTAPTGLTATADATHAEIDLAWTAHAGENLAGYRVYRKVSTTSTYEVLKSLVTTNSYSDRIPSSGVTYDYKVAAVATDGYEGTQSSAAQTSVTVSATWIDDTQVPLRSIPVISNPRRASYRIATNGSYITQDLGLLPRTATFVIACSTKALRDTYLAMFTFGHIFDYRGPDGETFRGKVIGDIAEGRFNLPPSQFVNDMTFNAVEVD